MRFWWLDMKPHPVFKPAFRRILCKRNAVLGVIVPACSLGRFMAEIGSKTIDAFRWFDPRPTALRTADLEGWAWHEPGDEPTIIQPAQPPAGALHSETDLRS